MDTGQLVQILVWPVVTLIIVLFFLISFRDSIKNILENLERAKGKIGKDGVEFEIDRQRVEAAASLGAATANKAGESTTKDLSANESKSRAIVDVVYDVKPKQLRRLADASVLWVDDNPSYNYYEKKSLEAFGIHFTDSKSTADALEKLKMNKYDVIISDMGRPENKLAGYQLLDEKNKLGDTAPFIIYSGSNLPEHKDEAHKKGAFGSTNNPRELFQLVLSAIQSE